MQNYPCTRKRAFRIKSHAYFYTNKPFEWYTFGGILTKSALLMSNFGFDPKHCQSVWISMWFGLFTVFRVSCEF